MHHDVEYLIVGGGMAAYAAAVGVRQQAETGPITILAEEADPPVRRPPLSKDLWLDEETGEADIVLDVAEETGAAVRLGVRAAALDPVSRTVTTDDGDTYGYQRLLLAVGGAPRELDGVPGGDRVVYFRRLADYRRLIALLESGARSIVVVGGGFIGTEIAAALVQQDGVSVTLVHQDDVLTGPVFPAALAEQVQATFVEHGVDVRGGLDVEGVGPDDAGVRVRLSDGSSVVADAVVVGAGIAPATQWLEGVLDLADDGGIVVDDRLAASVEHVYAAGDVASYPDVALGRTRVEHEDNALTQGRAAGRIMAGSEEVYDHTPYFYSDLFDDGYEALGMLDSSLETVTDLTEDGQVVYYLDDERVRGVLLWNVWEQKDAARDLLRSRKRPEDPADLRGTLG